MKILKKVLVAVAEGAIHCSKVYQKQSGAPPGDMLKVHCSPMPPYIPSAAFSVISKLNVKPFKSKKKICYSATKRVRQTLMSKSFYAKDSRISINSLNAGSLSFLPLVGSALLYIQDVERCSRLVGFIGYMSGMQQHGTSDHSGITARLLQKISPLLRLTGYVEEGYVEAGYGENGDPDEGYVETGYVEEGYVNI